MRLPFAREITKTINSNGLGEINKVREVVADIKSRFYWSPVNDYHDDMFSNLFSNIILRTGLAVNTGFLHVIY